MTFKFLRMPHHRLRFHLSDLRSVPRLMRPFTRIGRVHLGGVAIGVSLMFVGSSLAMYQWLPIHHLATDVLGYAIHGLGLVPILEHGRPLWVMLYHLESTE